MQSLSAFRSSQDNDRAAGRVAGRVAGMQNVMAVSLAVMDLPSGLHPTCDFARARYTWRLAQEAYMGLAVPKKGDPIEIATSFIERINAADVAGLYELMTEDHVFQDALGERFIGRDKMRHGWTQYFAMVGNYKIYVRDYFMKEESVAMFGTASGRYPANAGASAAGKNADGFWEVPAAWQVLVRDGRVAEWSVYADNQPLRKLMGEQVP
jgi:ketosteroid isomerase-like protein